MWTGFMWLRIWTSGGSCKGDDEPSGPMGGGAGSFLTILVTVSFSGETLLHRVS
jgi:hypothetical protein